LGAIIEKVSGQSYYDYVRESLRDCVSTRPGSGMSPLASGTLEAGLILRINALCEIRAGTAIAS